MLDMTDLVGVTFWIISAAMVAATYFFTVERDLARFPGRCSVTGILWIQPGTVECTVGRPGQPECSMKTHHRLSSNSRGHRRDRKRICPSNDGFTWLDWSSLTPMMTTISGVKRD